VFVDGDYTKAITFFNFSISKLRVFCQTLTNLNEKKQGNELMTELERELRTTVEHERMMGEIRENLSRSRPPPAAIIDERPVRDPDVFAYEPPQPIIRARDPPRRDVRSANNRAPAAKRTPDNKQKQHDNKPVNNGVSFLFRNGIC